MMFHKRLFGEALARLRGDRSMLQVARQAGIPSATWQAWERGETWPGESEIARILHGLDCTEEDLEVAMWFLQAEKILPRGSKPNESALDALASQHDQIKALLQVNYLDQIPENVRQVLIRLQVDVRETGARLLAVHADLETLVVALGQVS